MYVNYFDRYVRTEAENHTIGIVLCKKKNSALVEITLPKDGNIHARKYQLCLPRKEELQEKLVEWMGEQKEQKTDNFAGFPSAVKHMPPNGNMFLFANIGSQDCIDAASGPRKQGIEQRKNHPHRWGDAVHRVASFVK
jgi:hypothetical protein